MRGYLANFPIVIRSRAGALNLRKEVFFTPILLSLVTACHDGYTDGAVGNHETQSTK